jgi:hypothetical protein
MVLQQESKIEIWGWAKGLEKVELIFSWQKDTLRTVGDPNGNWSVTVLTPKAGGPHTIQVIGYNQIEIIDILIGETWLCSGQSNMEWKVRDSIENLKATLEDGNQPEIRYFVVNYQQQSILKSTLKEMGSLYTFYIERFKCCRIFFRQENPGLCPYSHRLIEAHGEELLQKPDQQREIRSNPVLTKAAKKLVKSHGVPLEQR